MPPPLPSPLLQLYIYEVQPYEIGPPEWRGKQACSAPVLCIDGEEWRNETAFLNCVFCSGHTPNVQPKVSGHPALAGEIVVAGCRLVCPPQRTAQTRRLSAPHCRP